MNRNDIDEILLINWYLVIKKLNTPNCDKVELTRKYLTAKINYLINKKKVVNKSPLSNILF
jgi:hypothetical protein